MARDWLTWHGEYDHPASSLAERLRVVQRHLAAAIDAAPPGPVQLLSLCAGQGRDVLGVLPDHPRSDDVRALLIENDPRNVALARGGAAALPGVEVRERDASRVASFADALPADVLLMCGIFGNVSDDDIERTVRACSALCSAGAAVIWTRHRRAPDLTVHIRRWFADSGFDEVAFEPLDTATPGSVGVHRLRDPVGTPPPNGPLFTFRNPQIRVC